MLSIDFTCSGVVTIDEAEITLKEDKSSLIERLGAQTDKYLQELFCRWGTGESELK